MDVPLLDRARTHRARFRVEKPLGPSGSGSFSHSPSWPTVLRWPRFQECSRRTGGGRAGRWDRQRGASASAFGSTGRSRPASAGRTGRCSTGSASRFGWLGDRRRDRSISHHSVGWHQGAHGRCIRGSTSRRSGRREGLHVRGSLLDWSRCSGGSWVPDAGLRCVHVVGISGARWARPTAARRPRTRPSFACFRSRRSVW